MRGRRKVHGWRPREDNADLRGADGVVVVPGVNSREPNPADQPAVRRGLTQHVSAAGGINGVYAPRVNQGAV